MTSASVRQTRRAGTYPFQHDPRPCACPCERRFRPVPTIGPVSTERYINAFHALRGRAVRLGLPDPGLPVSVPEGDIPARPRPRPSPSRNGTSPAPTAPRPRDPLQESRGDGSQWGVRRAVVADLELRANGRSRRVRLECGHDTTLTVGRTWSRCRRCLKGGA